MNLLGRSGVSMLPFSHEPLFGAFNFFFFFFTCLHQLDCFSPRGKSSIQRFEGCDECIATLRSLDPRLRLVNNSSTEQPRPRPTVGGPKAHF